MDWDVFWSVLFVVFIVIPIFMIWIFAIADLFMRPDIRGFTKVLWLFGIIFFPMLGTILYFLTRPAVPEARGMGPVGYGYPPSPTYTQAQYPQAQQYQQGQPQQSPQG